MRSSHHQQMLLWLVLIPACLGGCAILPFGGKPNSLPAQRSSPLGHGLKEFRAAFHVHCHLSHDSKGTIEEIAAAARQLGIDTVILNDHYEPGNIARAPRGVVDGVLFIPGVEVRRGNGSILSFALTEDFEKRLPAPEFLKEVERQGGLNVLGHVEEIEDWSLEPFQGFEVYNLHTEFKTTPVLQIAGRLLVRTVDSFFESSIRKPAANLALWDRELLRGRRLAPIGGHDAHANVHLFGPLGGTLGTYPELLRLFSTHILAGDWSSAELVKAIRAGRTFVAFDYLGDATGFALSYGPREAPADERFILGDAPPYQEGHTLKVAVPEGKAADVSTSVLRDGQVYLETTSLQFAVTLPGPGIYRTEVHAGGRLWILSAPMYIQGSTP